MSIRVCLVILAAALIGFARARRITVRGTFYCKNNPNAVVFLELWEKYFLKEDLLNWKLVSGNGPFEIDGHDDGIKIRKLFGSQPYLKFRHNCNSEPIEVISTFQFGIPKGDMVIDLEQVDLDFEKEED